MEPTITFTEDAADKIRSIIAAEGNPDLKLRVFVQGGGCSGFSYGFTLEEFPEEDDFQFEEHGVTIVVDSMSMQYLAGSSIDYEQELMGSQFVIKNPNSTGKCGCGSSFSV